MRVRTLKRQSKSGCICRKACGLTYLLDYQHINQALCGTAGNCGGLSAKNCVKKQVFQAKFSTYFVVFFYCFFAVRLSRFAQIEASNPKKPKQYC